jgi:hypothetical protein
VAGAFSTAFDVAFDGGIASPFSDDFVGANGQPWNPVKWDQDTGAGGGDTIIDTNRGKAEGATGQANSGGRGIGKQGQVPNQEMTGTFQLCELNEPCHGALWLQTSNDWEALDNPTNGYGVYLPSDSDDASLVLASAGVVSVLDTATWPRDAGLKQFRFRRQQNKVRFRIWNDGDAEPEGWTLSADDSTLAPSGVGAFQIAYTCPLAPSVDACALYDEIVVDENNNPIPEGGSANRMGGTGAIRNHPKILVG